MARSHRFHLDQGGHSVTVQTGAVPGGVELLVDGKVVAVRRRHRKDVTVLAADLPGDPPQPFTIRLGRSEETGDVPVCVMETHGSRVSVPYAPLAARQAASLTADAQVHPLRWLRRVIRRRSRNIRLSRR
ncbi:hypothetical protein AB0I98_38800 [Streptomyces sp. NPDC050211]|uniref:hypothetical protein n=1 Tax=Streptomyces sp. NPDC050211 TaxID=3154932 RepID=UPI0034299ADA